MGLYLYASRRPWLAGERHELTRDDERAFEEAAIDLGQRSGPGTFWGWDWWAVVTDVHHGEMFDGDASEEHRWWVPPDVVRKIATAFDECDASEVARAASGRRPFTAAHIEGFRRFFRVCAERGLGLVWAS